MGFGTRVWLGWLILLPLGPMGTQPAASVWTHDGALTPRAQQVLEVLRDAASQGLNPGDYVPPPLAGDPERFDAALTAALTRYVSDRYGADAPDKDALPDLVRHVTEAADLPAALDQLDPPYDGFRRARAALRQYRVLAGEDSGELLPVPQKPVDPGKPYAGVARLAQLLRKLGDLPADAAPPADVYGGALVDAVKHFQMRHGLQVDGRLGKSTLEQLNTPLSRRVRQLELSLERWRWLPRRFANPPVIVNIPEFQVRAGSDLEMKVVVGQARGWHTPLFSAQLTHVIFRPYWNVPARIQRRELVRDLERDPAYLAAHGFEVVTSRDQVVTNREVTPAILAQLRSGQLRLRQVPGPENSLGGVKFVFPNSYDVYMHDTPAKALFQRARRDLSHGCIRVEKAEDLAVWVLRDDPSWPRERIREAMQRSTPLEVRLKQPIPVLIVYMTASVLESGEVRFFSDIYGLDEWSGL